MQTKTVETFWARINMSGPIDIAKQTIRVACLQKGLCVTVQPTTFIYTGGEEVGFTVGLLNYSRFPTTSEELTARALDLMQRLLEATCQHSGLLMTPEETIWISKRSE
jgi:hypothetical protein